ncbi:MAG: sugar phosphate isomerase/epimerase [Verrucomicrobiae bacterium]|nr:sugar phosphate isomerase/epimerase [Verrucomicrobiae bacterium]
MEHRFGQTSRREFLRVIAPLWVAIFSAKGSSRDTESYKIGCYTRPWDQYDYRTALDGIAEAGFAYAGIMTAKGPSWLIIHTGTPEEEVISVKNEARQRGLKIISLYAGEFNVQRSVDEGIQGLRRLIDYCALCECPNLMLAGTPETRLVQDYCRVVRECCEYAAAKNVQLAIKPHGGPNATGPQCRKIIERVGHPRFRLWYDPGNLSLIHI